MSDSSSRQSSIPFRAQKRTPTPSHRDFKSTPSSEKHSKQIPSPAISDLSLPRGTPGDEPQSPASNQASLLGARKRKDQNFEVNRTYKKTVEEESRERFALISHPTNGVSKIKIQDSEGFKVPFPRTKEFKKLSQKTQSIVKSVLLENKQGLTSPSSSQFSGMRSSLSPQTQKIIENSLSKKKQPKTSKSNEILKRYPPAFKYEHLLEGERTLGLPPHYKILQQQQTKLDLTLNGMLQGKNSSGRWRSISYLSEIITRNHLLDMNVTILKQFLFLQESLYDTIWNKNEKGNYELHIAFPLKKETKHLDSQTKRVVSSRISGTKNVFRDSVEKSSSSRKKVVFAISSEELRGRQIEFKKALLNECLFHYDQNVSQIPIEKRPTFDPVKEQVWPRFFDLENVPSVPPAGKIAEKPQVKKKATLTDFLEEEKEHSDTLLKAAIEKAAKITEQKKNTSPDRQSVSSSQSSITSNKSSARSYLSVSSNEKSKKPLIIPTHKKQRLRQQNLLASQRSRSPSPLIRDPTLSMKIPKEKAFIEIKEEEKREKPSSSYLSEEFLRNLRLRKQVLDELGQQSAERVKEGEVSRIENMLNQVYTLKGKRNIMIDDIYQKIQQQLFDTRGERLRFEQFMSLVKEVKGFALFEVEHVGTFLKRIQ